MNDRDQPPAALLERFRRVCAEPSDINEHLGILWGLARQCEHVTEFGVRGGVSTTALLMAQPVFLECFDREPCPVLDELFEIRGSTFLNYYWEDSRQAIPCETDLLHIDTEHNYACLSAELQRHASKVGRWIALHDTQIFGDKGDDGGPGLNQAIAELIAGGKWREWGRWSHNNGMTVLQRIKPE